MLLGNLYAESPFHNYELISNVETCTFKFRPSMMQKVGRGAEGN